MNFAEIKKKIKLMKMTDSKREEWIGDKKYIQLDFFIDNIFIGTYSTYYDYFLDYKKNTNVRTKLTKVSKMVWNFGNIAKALKAYELTIPKVFFQDKYPNSGNNNTGPIKMSIASFKRELKWYLIGDN